MRKICAYFRRPEWPTRRSPTPGTGFCVKAKENGQCTWRSFIGTETDNKQSKKIELQNYRGKYRQCTAKSEKRNKKSHEIAGVIGTKGDDGKKYFFFFIARDTFLDYQLQITLICYPIKLNRKQCILDLS